MNLDSAQIAFWLTLLGVVCWVPCFYWMHRISARQDRMLHELHDQGRRIERLAKAEHDLIKEVHPQVSEIKEAVEAVVAGAAEGTLGGQTGAP